MPTPSGSSPMNINVTHQVTVHQLYLIYRQNRLTDALEFLENLGYCGDTALSVLRWVGGAL